MGVEVAAVIAVAKATMTGYYFGGGTNAISTMVGTVCEYDHMSQQMAAAYLVKVYCDMWDPQQVQFEAILLHL